MLHYALLPQGYLFLGCVGDRRQSAGPVHVSSIGMRASTGAIERPRDRLPILPQLPNSRRVPEFASIPRPHYSGKAIDSAFHRQVLEDIAPPSMLVDKDRTIANLSETAGRFLLHPAGPMLTDAAEIVRPELRLELRAALHRALEHGLPSVSLPVPVQFNGSPTNVVLHVRPVPRDDGPTVALVMFLEGSSTEVLARELPTGRGTLRRF